MATIVYESNAFLSLSGETVLETLLRNGVEIRFSCKKGSCQTCKTKVLEGSVPAEAQKGLPPHLRENRIVLPCICIPETDMVLAVPSPSDLRQKALEKSPYELRNESHDEHPRPDPELWKALDEGALLLEILTEFYFEVYRDIRLSPFFAHTTIDRAIGKQYNFLEEIITGKMVYFGAYPRNAHHWMVISNELFDYRENLLEKVMLKFGLPEVYRKRWRNIHEHYRSRMVKEYPWPKIVGGQVIPLGNFEEMVSEIEMVCDQCQNEVLEGSMIRYHPQEGQVYCKTCAGL